MVAIGLHAFGFYAIGLYQLVNNNLRVFEGFWGVCTKMGGTGGSLPHKDYVIQINCLQFNCLRFYYCNFLLQLFVVDPLDYRSLRIFLRAVPELRHCLLIGWVDLVCGVLRQLPGTTRQVPLPGGHPSKSRSADQIRDKAQDYAEASASG